MKYALAVDVKLMQLPDDPDPIEIPEGRPGDDPIARVGGVLTQFSGLMKVPVAPFMGQPAGFDFRKEIRVSVHDFQGLAAIIERFDSLVTEIETERIAAHS